MHDDEVKRQPPKRGNATLTHGSGSGGGRAVGGKCPLVDPVAARTESCVTMGRAAVVLGGVSLYFPSFLFPFLCYLTCLFSTKLIVFSLISL